MARKQHFYSHIIEIDAVMIQLELLDLEPEEKKELHALLESQVHHAVLDTVLSELNEDEKKKFLEHLADDKHDAVWDLLKNVKDIETKIRKTVDTLKKDLHEDIKESKRKNNN